MPLPVRSASRPPRRPLTCEALEGRDAPAAGPFQYSSSSNTITVTGPVTATLSDIRAALPTAPLSLVSPAKHVWLLKANLRLAQGATLNLAGSAAGGDVDELRLKSNNVAGAGVAKNVVYIRADWGTIRIDSVAVKSWDEAAGGVDTEYATNGRAYIQARSTLDPDGVTAHESRLDVRNSDIGYLGYNAAESYGLSWKVVGSPGAAVTDATGNPTFALYEKVNVYGDVTNTRVHHSYFGLYTYGAFGMQIRDNEVDNNVGYGVDGHDDSDRLLVQGNHVHHNGYDGVIVSKRCDHVQFLDNVVEDNKENGLFFHAESNDGLMQGNVSRDNGLAGVTVLGSVRAVVRNNTVTGNALGLTATAGSSGNLFEGNDVGGNRKYGINLATGTNPKFKHGDGRQRDNVFRNNTVHDNGSYGVRAVNADNTLYQGNTFANNGSSKLSFEDVRGDRLDGNTLQPNQIVAAVTKSSVTVRNQPEVKVNPDTTSTFTFEDPAGRLFEAVGLAVPTVFTGTGPSTLVLTRAAAGGGTDSVRVLTRPLTATPGAGQSVQGDPTVWQTDGGRAKKWTARPSAAAQTIRYTVGDLTPGQAYTVTRDVAVVARVTADGAGTVTFSDFAGTTGTITYAVAPG